MMENKEAGVLEPILSVLKNKKVIETAVKANKSLKTIKAAKITENGVKAVGAGILVGAGGATMFGSREKTAELLIKIAKKLNISNFEDDYLGGAMLSDKGESKAKKLYAQKVNDSFVLRHPFLTGVPTLGIAPMMADDSAKSSVARKLIKSDTKLQRAYNKYKQDERQHKYRMKESAAGATKINTSVTTMSPELPKIAKVHTDRAGGELAGAFLGGTGAMKATSKALRKIEELTGGKVGKALSATAIAASVIPGVEIGSIMGKHFGNAIDEIFSKGRK